MLIINGLGGKSTKARRIAWSSNFIKPEESLWSIFNRFNYINRFRKSEFKSYIGIEKGESFSMDLFSVGYIVDSSDSPTGFRYSKFLIKELGLKNFNASTIRYSERDHFLLSPDVEHLRFCPVCITLSFHSVVFQYPHIFKCPVHDIQLQSRCPKCKSSIEVDCNENLFSKSYCCTKCSAPLAQRKNILNVEEQTCFSNNELSSFWKIRRSINYSCKNRTAYFFRYCGGNRKTNKIDYWPDFLELMAQDYQASKSNLVYEVEADENHFVWNNLFKERNNPKSIIKVFERGWYRIVARNKQELESQFDIRLSQSVVSEARLIFITILERHKWYCEDKGIVEFESLLYGDDSNRGDKMYFGHDLITCNLEELRHPICLAAFKIVLLALALECIIVSYCVHKEKRNLSWVKRLHNTRLPFVPTCFFCCRNKKLTVTAILNKNDVKLFMADYIENIDKYTTHPMERIR